MKTKYTVDYFLRFFSRIPNKRWCMGCFRDERGRCCAAGHLGDNDDGNSPRRALALYELFRKNSLAVNQVNDDELLDFPQRTPRARILAALRRIKRKQTA